MTMNFLNLTAGTTVALVATAGLPLANNGDASGFIGGRVYIVAKDGLDYKGEMAVKNYEGKTFRMRTDRFVIVGHEDIKIFDGTPSYNIAGGTLLFAPTTAKKDGYLQTVDDLGYTVNIPLDTLVDFEDIAEVITMAEHVITTPAVRPTKIEGRTFFRAGSLVTCVSAANSKVSLTEGNVYEVVETNSPSGFIKIIADSGKRAKVRETRFAPFTPATGYRLPTEEDMDDLFTELFGNMDGLFEEELHSCNACVESPVCDEAVFAEFNEGDIVVMMQTYGMPSGAIFHEGNDYEIEGTRYNSSDKQEILMTSANDRRFWLNADRVALAGTGDLDTIVTGDLVKVVNSVDLPANADFREGDEVVVLDIRTTDAYELLVEGYNGRKFWLNMDRFMTV